VDLLINFRKKRYPGLDNWPGPSFLWEPKKGDLVKLYYAYIKSSCITNSIVAELKKSLITIGSCYTILDVNPECVTQCYEVKILDDNGDELWLNDNQYFKKVYNAQRFIID